MFSIVVDRFANSEQVLEAVIPHQLGFKGQY